MIHYWIKDQLQAALPNVEVTVDYEPNEKEYLTVFFEGGGAPGRHDLNDRYPNYMVWIQSPDYGYAEYLAETVFNLFNQYTARGAVDISVEYYKGNQLLRTEVVELQHMVAVSEPNRIGVEDGAMQYTVNLATRITQKEEPVHE